MPIKSSSIQRRTYEREPMPRRPEARDIVAAKGYSVLGGDPYADRDGSAVRARMFEIALRGLVVGLGFLVGSALVVMVAKIVMANLRAIE